MPCDIVRLPCGSMSTHRTRWPSSTKAAARLSVVVVFATPPFWLAKAMTLAWPVTARLLGSVGEPSAPDSRPRGVLLPSRHNGPVTRARKWFRLPGERSFLALAFGDVTSPCLRRRYWPARRDRLLPRQPRGAVAAVLLRARRRHGARALGAAARRAHRLRHGARLDAADRRGDGPRARQRAAHAGDHRADDGPAAGARRAVARRSSSPAWRCGSCTTRCCSPRSSS